MRLRGSTLATLLALVFLAGNLRRKKQLANPVYPENQTGNGRNAAECEPPPTINPQSQIDPTPARQNNAETGRQPRRWLSPGLEVVTLLAVLGSAYATYQQWQTMEKTLKTQQRPYLMPGDDHQILTDKIVPGDVIHANISFKNTGLSPALDIVVASDMSFGPFDAARVEKLQAFTKSGAMKYLSPPSIAVVAPSASGFITLESKPISEKEFDQWGRGRKYPTLTIFGVVAYRDIFSGSHETDFCITQLGNGAWAYCPKYNRLR